MKFGDIEIQKQKFHQHKEPISIKNVDINKIVLFNKVSLVKKNLPYFIGYKDAKKNRPLCISVPKMSTYRKDFDESKHICFDKWWSIQWNYNEIWEKVKNIIQKELDRETVYNKKYLRTKIKCDNGKINTNFHNNKIPKEGSQFICLSIILIDSVFRTGKNYYPQVLLEEY